MKKLFKLVSVVLVFVMLFSFAACAKNNGPDAEVQAPQADANKYADIAGEYYLDATELGMAMKWYIKITADGKFAISTKRDFTDEKALKGEGTIGENEGTYMLLYSDSTTETPKTATFKFEGKDMVFSTRVPIGAAGVNPSDDGTKFPTAVLIANEEILGTYFGTYEKTAMGSAIAYNYELELAYGSKYTFVSSVTMGANTLIRTEKGTFSVDGTEISFKALDVDGETVAEPAEVKGTLGENGITAAFKLSSMASAAQEIEAKLGTYTEWKGTYTASYEKTMGGAMSVTIARICTLELDPFGAYKYTAIDAEDMTTVDYEEKGTYTVVDGKLSFTSDAEGASAIEGTYASYILATKFPISSDMPTPVELSFYAEEASGNFYAMPENEGKTYLATLSLIGDKFALVVGDIDAETESYFLEGTFKIEAGMIAKIAFTTEKAYTTATMETEITDIPAELSSFSFPIAESGINGELLFDLEDTAKIAFEFTHTMPEMPEEAE